ncbi:type ISP restriction/modification enzyme [Salinarimonas chemoclinalis]|uniref:type ISP restriction/modification enzyme n=1 Tax=Salinarimonas chemoclinalis TaxID=3241599 RepID=UPI0035561C2C
MLVSREELLLSAVSEYGRAVREKLARTTIDGEPEDQLRAPLEALFQALAAELVPGRTVGLVGETRLSDLKTRPDYAVNVDRALCGFVEVKAPGKGADARRFRAGHDRDQWKKLQALPNLLYTDGTAFALFRDGEIVGGVVELEGDIETAGPALRAPTALWPLIEDFLGWKPQAPKTAKTLAHVSARLCRFLRDEAMEQLAAGNAALTGLAQDWRALLFPEANDAQFADGYAQAVTFGLLVARTRDIDIVHGIADAARDLRRQNSLIGTALMVLTDHTETEPALKTSLGTLSRVLNEVNWAEVSKGDPEAWLYFYEQFLEVYDNDLRKLTGSYYTPPQVVETMVRLVDEALRDPSLFDEPDGLAAGNVTVADPAVGTGTFPLGVLRRIAQTVEARTGAGAVPGAIEAAASRLFGFEMQFGPFAVAQLRLFAELRDLLERETRPALNLYVTDTLGDPFIEEVRLGTTYEPIAQSRRDANRVKRETPITVVIGNPPYKEKAKGRGGWIEDGLDGRDRTPLQRWMPPPDWGVGAHAKHLYNLYIFFWRWATWKVFGAGDLEATGREGPERPGIVCFITVSGFLTGPGFQAMRADLRRSCSDVWVIDCSPEGHQPEVATRIFQGVQHPVCIVLAARRGDTDPETPARVRFRALAEGRREAKFAELAGVRLDDSGWADCPADLRAPFRPGAGAAWGAFPALDELFAYDGSGVMPGRTWVIASDPETLRRRWDRLIGERDVERKKEMFYPHLRNKAPGDRHLHKQARQGLTGHEHRSYAVADDATRVIEPTRYAFRTLDRQWLIPDARLINQANPTLWDLYSSNQMFMTAPEDRSAESGPAITICGLIPDLHHYNGRGGRVFPLWADAAATESNVKPALLAVLTARLGRPVGAEDVMAYVAALLAHPAFTARFAEDLRQPGLRVPLTADPDLFAEAARLGREVIWLHTYGERCIDPAAGRPHEAPRMPQGERPHVPAGGAIPGDRLPEEMSYDPATRRLAVGDGVVANVTPAMWAYEVSGKNVLRQWFSYRKADRSRPVIGDRRPPSELERIIPDGWLAQYTTDLIDLLNVLGRLVALEPAQADLLGRVLAGPLLDRADLAADGAFAAPAARVRRSRTPEGQGTLL